MEVSDFAPVLVQIAFAAGLAAVILVASHFLGQRGSQGSIKNSPYECGVKSDGKTSTRFSVKFYVTAMLFILFDIEVLFLIPWAMIYRDFLADGLPILGPILFFLGVLVVGLVYELKKGGLDWEK
ncbi:MAG: NADH-quinone oxidoreductase subunit A [Opitutales bacterium]|jgi:NADH-quinone oxidoreductase subunit A|nr:NADH-quinone oxidoreductase subunit A [Opitutales bacterium]MDG2254388.1 NADH-quinone oxidoreductase subunit A [Opitutaceae bacterium]MBT5168807.1 NADH-quinone oxidoreductase subunit A [Opitutales bacterium]MBT5814676.1 NADH-quinone oxidoreductase subunit A [Opitutales bacterium]MBT6379449.1 NADH-quinone oxidoreductase subunit A [Opitutales bacterium]